MKLKEFIQSSKPENFFMSVDELKKKYSVEYKFKAGKYFLDGSPCGIHHFSKGGKETEVYGLVANEKIEVTHYAEIGNDSINYRQMFRKVAANIWLGCISLEVVTVPTPERIVRLDIPDWIDSYSDDISSMPMFISEAKDEVLKYYEQIQHL